MSKLRYGSVCSGIEAATVAWHQLGWIPAWFSEIEPFPSKVLAYHYPNVPNLGDMTKLLHNEQFKQSAIDVLVGGTPCQSFSMAGLRGGLDTENGNLALEFCRLLIAKRPTWFVWENVPGVFSSFSDEEESKVYGAGTRNKEPKHKPGGGGRERGNELEYDCEQTSDFATLLTAFRECGYSCAWRVLDSQYFGVPQRRRRVFVVGYLGEDWRPPFAVLFERESMRRDLAPSRETRETTSSQSDKGIDCRNIAELDDVSGTIQSAEHGYSINKINPIIQQAFGEYIDDDTASALKKRDYKSPTDLIVFDPNLVFQPTNRSSLSPGEPSSPLLKGSVPIIIPINTMTVQGRPSDNGRMGIGIGEDGDPSPTISKNHSHAVVVLDRAAFNQGENAKYDPQIEETETNPSLIRRGPNAVQYQEMIRRLTPLECERLQGFPDNYTNIPGASDTVRYQALGNSMTTDVMAWIGQRIDMVDRIIKES